MTIYPLAPFNYQVLIESMPGVFLVANSSCRIVTASKGYLKEAGRTLDELVGSDIVQEISSSYLNGEVDGFQRLRHSISSVIESGRIGELKEQYRMRRRGNGFLEEKYFDHISTPVGGSAGRPDFILHTIKDVTEQHQAEKKFHAYMDAVPEAIIVVNEKGMVTQINLQAEQLLGYSSFEMSGQSLEMIFPSLIKVMEESEPARQHFIKKWMETNKALSFKAVKKNGVSIPAIVTAAPVYTDTGTYISLCVRDNTHNLQTAEQLSLLRKQIADSSEAIYTVSVDGIITSWNKGAEKQYGFKAEEVVGKKSLDVLKTEVTKEAIKTSLDIVEKEDYWLGELKRKRKDGSDIYVNLSISSIRDQHKIITGYVSVSQDITREKMLRKQVEHLARIAEQSSEAIISRGMDGKIISWNRGAENLFGFTAAEALGKTLSSLGVIEIFEHETPELEKNIKENLTWKTEVNFLNKKGQALSCYVTGNAVTGGDGLVNAIVFVINDITHRKQLEQELINANNSLEKKIQERTDAIKKTEGRFRAIVENSYDIITLLDQHFNIIYRTPSASRITGWSNEEVFGKLGTMNVHPDDMGKASAISREIMEFPDKQVFCSFRIKHKAGHYIWLEGTVVNYLQDESVGAIVFNFRDVSERVKAEQQLVAEEERYRYTLDNMLEGIQIIGFDWKCIYVNDACAKHARHERSEVIGKTMMDIYPGIRRTRLYLAVKSCLEERKTYHFEHRFVFPDGKELWLELSIRPVPEGVFVLSVDVSDRKNAERKEKQVLAEKALMANRLTAILNTLPAKIALIDKDGILVDANKNWEKCNIGSVFLGKNFPIGINYIQELLKSKKSSQLAKAIQGIEKVMVGESDYFVHEYSCSSGGTKHWFRMVVTPVKKDDNGGVVIMHIDISELKKMEEERMHHKIEEQKKLSHVMVMAQEKERNAIGMELHDNVNQLLVATSLLLSVVIQQPSKVDELIPGCIDNLKKAIQENRKIAHELVVPDLEAQGSLIQQIQSISDGMLQSAGIRARLNKAEYDDDKLNEEQKLAVYRVVQEQCNNIVKYANARQVQFKLSTRKGVFNMTISDDGKGAQPGKFSTGIGLKNISSRLSMFNGKISVHTSPGEGFSLKIALPYQ